MQWAVIACLFVSFALFVLLGRTEKKRKTVFVAFSVSALLSLVLLFVWGIARNF